MICQACGSRPAVVHLNELRDGQRSHRWLCEQCAANRQDGDAADPGGGGGFGADQGSPGGDPNFTSFLSQMFETPAGGGSGADSCPACGFTLNLLGKTNRLGCPACYDAFRRPLQPLLARLHRHSSHLGKRPWRTGGSLTPEGELARHRVALEKAIVAEQFEEAARLRDLINRYEQPAAPAAKEADPGNEDENPTGEVGD